MQQDHNGRHQLDTSGDDAPYTTSEAASYQQSGTPDFTPSRNDSGLNIVDFPQVQHNKSLPELPLSSRIYKFLNKKDNKADAPPNGGIEAWLQVVAGFFIFMNNFGLASAFGVYQAYYQLYMLPNHSASAISWIGTLQAAQTLIVGILSGPLFDKGFFFQTTVIASIGLVFSFMMLSLSTQYWQILLTQGLLAGFCTGLLYIPSISILPLYFTTRRGTALGMVLSGASIGGIVYPLIFRNLLERHGFPWATRIIGFVALVTLTTSLILIKPLVLPNRPRKLRDPTMFKDPYYVTFLTAGFLAFLSIFTPFFNSGTFGIVKLHMNINEAFYTLVATNAGNFFGRVILCALTDHGIGPEHLINFSVVALVALAFGWIGVTSKAGFYVYLILWGFFSGGIFSLPATQLPWICPKPEVFATRLGVVYGFAGIGVLIGTPIANAIDDHQGGFLGSQLWTGITMAISLPFAIYSGIGAGKNRMAIQAMQKQQRNEMIEQGKGNI